MAIKGIDASHWQGNIDWSKVKAAGIQFAIIKAGGSDDGFYTDSKWEANYKGAKANGIVVRAYYFVGPKCVNAAAGKADAERFIQLLKGKQLEYPVFMDNEAQPASAKAGITEATIAFCETMEAAGYFVGIYGSTDSGFHERMDDSKLTAYTHWVAQYASKCTYSGSYGIWQNSSSGRVSGISGNVDMDLSYVDYPSAIKNGGFNGYAKGTATGSTHEEVRGRDRLRGDRREMGKRRRPQEQAHHRRIQLQRRAVEGQREARSNGKTIRRLLHGETRRHALGHRKQVRHKRLRHPEAQQLTYQEREPHPGWLEDSREITYTSFMPTGLFLCWIAGGPFLF